MNRKLMELFGYTLSDFSTVPDWVVHAYLNSGQARLTEAGGLSFLKTPLKMNFK